jgi:hypothetical protein
MRLHAKDEQISHDEGKAIPVTGCEGAYGCETSRFPYFLDNRLIDGGKVFSLLPPTKFPGTHLSDAESDPKAIVRLEGLGQLKKYLPHQDSNPRPSKLYHSASTNYATACSPDFP